MKKCIGRFALSAAVLLLSGSALWAQQKEENKDKDKDKMKQYDEIIIRKKSDKDLNSKVTIEIDNGQVKVNGKPVEDFNDNNLSIRLRSMPRLAIASPFRSNGVYSFNGDQLFSGSGNAAFLGVSTTEEDNGAKVESVTEGSAAEKAGLKEDDIITRIDDQKIAGPADLTKAIGKYKPEDKITVTYLRNGKEAKATATLGKNENAAFGFSTPEFRYAPDVRVMPRMDGFNWNRDGNGFSIVSGRPRLGIRAQDTEAGKGVKVLDVMDESAAEKAGIKEGDIITEFNGKTVNSADELTEAARDAREKNEIAVKLTRDGKPVSVTVKIPKKLKTANL